MMYIMPLFVQFFDLFGVKLTGNDSAANAVNAVNAVNEGNEGNEGKEKRVQFAESDMPPAPLSE